MTTGPDRPLTPGAPGGDYSFLDQPETFSVVFDTVQCRPGCAILQAILGGSPSIANEFPVKSWLTAPTPNMNTYSTTREQLDQIVAIVRKKYGRT